MIYVARFTQTPHEDIQRGWSAWMGDRGDLWTVADREFSQVVEDGQCLDTNDFETEGEILEKAEELGLEYRQYPHSGDWAFFHHEGLSCWELEAPSKAEALEEAIGLHNSKKIDWSGFGHATEGNVQYVAPVPGVEDLHLFTCEGVSVED
jgi:hypothetical protein